MGWRNWWPSKHNFDDQILLRMYQVLIFVIRILIELEPNTNMSFVICREAGHRTLMVTTLSALSSSEQRKWLFHQQSWPNKWLNMQDSLKWSFNSVKTSFYGCQQNAYFDLYMVLEIPKYVQSLIFSGLVLSCTDRHVFFFFFFFLHWVFFELSLLTRDW